MRGQLLLGEFSDAAALFWDSVLEFENLSIPDEKQSVVYELLSSANDLQIRNPLIRRIPISEDYREIVFIDEKVGFLQRNEEVFSVIDLSGNEVARIENVLSAARFRNQFIVLTKTGELFIGKNDFVSLGKIEREGFESSINNWRLRPKISVSKFNDTLMAITSYQATVLLEFGNNELHPLRWWDYTRSNKTRAPQINFYQDLVGFTQDDFIEIYNISIDSSLFIEKGPSCGVSRSQFTAIGDFHYVGIPYREEETDSCLGLNRLKLSNDSPVEKVNDLQDAGLQGKVRDSMKIEQFGNKFSWGTVVYEESESIKGRLFRFDSLEF